MNYINYINHINYINFTRQKSKIPSDVTCLGELLGGFVHCVVVHF